MKTVLLRALVLSGTLAASLAVLACGGEEDPFEGQNQRCVAMASRYADLYIECGLGTDRNEEISKFGCGDVEDAPKERVDACIARLETLTCATLGAPAECADLFRPKSASAP